MNNKYLNSLRTHRMTAGLRQVDVARIVGVDFMDRISLWECGKAMPNITNLFRLAALYNVPPHELYLELWNGIKQRQVERSEIQAEVHIA